jgi:tRNA dimethylallyltransferase
LRADLEAMSDADLRSRLEKEAPEDANRIHANDRRRTIRALERAAGEEGSPTASRAWDGPPREDFVAIGLDWPVESINRRINARVKAMAADGLIDEVRALHDANRLGRQAREALGYREIVDHLEGRCSAEDAFERIKIGTRRFAKQQRTWLRRFRILPRTIWLSAEGKTAAELASEAEKHIFSTYGGPSPSTE